MMEKLLSIKVTVTGTSERLDRYQQDLQLVNRRVNALEQRTNEVEDVVPRYKTLEKRMAFLEYPLDGLPEQTEGEDPILYLEKLLPQFLKLSFSHQFQIDAAHRINTRGRATHPPRFPLGL